MNFNLKILVLPAVFVLVACNGGGGGDSGQGNAQTGNGDPFIATVQQLSATAPENAEPEDVDAAPVTMPENVEPVNAG